VAKDKDALLLSPKFVPEIGGLFDPVIFGGMKGTRWGHVKLEEPVINPVFEDCVRSFLGGTKQSVLQTLYQEGGEALKKRLNAIDIGKEIKATEENLKSPKFTGDALDKQVKKLKYLRALQDQGLKPGDAYMQSVVPITPPYLRPITISATGDKTESDSNKLYRDLILQNNTFKKMKEAGLDDLPGSRESLYTRVRELSGVLSPESPLLRNRGVKGALAYIAGDTPKQGFFQRKVIYSKMNLTGRATIAPDNTLGMDEVGMPIDMAWSLYKPFVLRKLTQLGKSVMEAKKEVEVRSKVATKLLEEELLNRPVMVNRAPTLWRNSIFSAYPVLRQGKTLLVNTLWESATNSDHDGDSIYNSVIYRQKLNNRSQNYILNFCEKSPHSLLQEDNKASSVDAQITQNNNVMEEEEMPFAKDTTVRYMNGLINLEDFPRIEETKEVVGNKEKYKVPQDIEVFTVKDGVGAWLPVDEFSIHHDLKMVECITNTKRSVLCSIDHSLVTVDEDLNYVKAIPNVGLTIPRVVAESNGGVLKSITFQNSTKENHKVKSEIPLDYNFGWLNGAFISDGWVDDAKTVAICKVDVGFRQAVLDIGGALLDGGTLHSNLSHHPHEFKGRDCFSSKLLLRLDPLYHYLKDNIGRGAVNKHLPEFWMETSVDFRKGLLAGLIDGDGSVAESKAVSKNKSQWSIQYTSISKRLIFEIVALANSLGMTATACFSKITDAGNEAWAVIFTTESIAKIQKELVLYHSKKSERLASAEIDLSLINRKRFTPRLSKKRLSELRLALNFSSMRDLGVAKTKEDQMALNSINATLSKTIKRNTVLTEDTANKIINFLMRVPEDRIDQCIPRTDPFWLKWAAMVIDPNIKWDMIESLKAVPEITTGYDLTIPPAYTMVTESGLVVWDTETVHVPVTKESVEDAKRMLPSNMVFSDKKIGDILQFPKGETVAGLYKATRNLGVGGATVAPKRFHNEAEAWSAYYTGSLKATDPVEIGG
jgi:intein/homing endonuclease